MPPQVSWLVHCFGQRGGQRQPQLQAVWALLLLLCWLRAANIWTRISECKDWEDRAGQVLVVWVYMLQRQMSIDILLSTTGAYRVLQTACDHMVTDSCKLYYQDSTSMNEDLSAYVCSRSTSHSNHKCASCLCTG